MPMELILIGVLMVLLAIEKATIANRLKYFADERAINKKYDDLEAAARKMAADEAAKKAKEARDKEKKSLKNTERKKRPYMLTWVRQLNKWN